MESEIFLMNKFVFNTIFASNTLVMAIYINIYIYILYILYIIYIYYIYIYIER